MSTRREFLKLGVTGVAALAVGGLAGNLATKQLAEREKAELMKEISELKEKIGIELEPGLNILNWTYYMNRILSDWWVEEVHGMKLIYDTIESTDELMAKFKAGAAGYDLVNIGVGQIDELVDGNLIQPINHKKVPNFKYVPEDFRDLKGYDPGNKYTMPYAIGTTGIGFNANLVPPPMPSHWGDLFEVEKVKRFNKKCTTIPGATSLTAALQYLGYHGSSADPDELEEAKEVLIRVKPYMAKYASTEEVMTGLISERFICCQVWNGDMAGAFYEASETEITVTRKYPHLQYVLPRPKCSFWIDNWAISAEAPHPEAAHAFINFWLDPRVSAINSLTVKYAMPNTLGIKFIPVEIASDETIFPKPEAYKYLELGKPLTEEEREAREAVWLEVMAA